MNWHVPSPEEVKIDDRISLLDTYQRQHPELTVAISSFPKIQEEGERNSELFPKDLASCMLAR